MYDSFNIWTKFGNCHLAYSVLILLRQVKCSLGIILSQNTKHSEEEKEDVKTEVHV